MPHPTLAERRRALGLTQEQLAIKVRVSTATVSTWETGEKRPIPRNARKLAKALGVTVEELGLREGDP